MKCVKEMYQNCNLQIGTNVVLKGCFAEGRIDSDFVSQVEDIQNDDYKNGMNVIIYKNNSGNNM